LSKKTASKLFGLVLLSLIWIGTSSLALSPNIKSSRCIKMHEGTFSYGPKYSPVIVRIKGDRHTELHNRGKQHLKSKLVWIDSCTFQATLESVTVKNSTAKVGDVLTVRIRQIFMKKYYVEITLNGESWKSTLLRVDEDYN
jgi:hypothetical protein